MRIARGGRLNKMRRRANNARRFESERLIGADTGVDDVVQAVFAAVDDLHNA